MATLLEKCNNIKNDKDTNLKPENLKAGVTCLGVTGTLTELDTSDATATSSDIAFGKTAYVNGKKVEGLVYEVPAGSSLTLEGSGAEDLPGQNKLLVACPSEADVFFKQNSNADIVTSYDKIANAIQLTPDKLVKGNTILGVDGTAEIGDAKGVKVFTSVDEMNSNISAQEGDLGIIYTNVQMGITTDSEFDEAVFPKTVVLPSSMGDDYAEIRFRSIDTSVMFDCWGSLDQYYFNLDCYSDNGEIRIMYESNDGITYTKIEGEDIVNFGTIIKFGGTWHDAIGKFIQIKSCSFEGLYEFGYTPESDIVSLHGQYYRMPKNLLTETFIFNGNEIPYFFQKDMGDSKVSGSIIQIVDTENDEIYNNVLKVKEMNLFYGKSAHAATVIALDTGIHYATFSVYDGIKFTTIHYKDGNINRTDFTDFNLFQAAYPNVACSGTPGYVSYFADFGILNEQSYIQNIGGLSYEVFATDTYGSTKVTNPNLTMTELTHAQYDYMILKWNIAPTQFSIVEKDILPNKIGYGAQGVVIGDGSIYKNLDAQQIHPNITFNDVSAGVYAKTKALYKDLQPIILTDKSQVDKTIYIIPKNENNELLIDHSQISDLSFMYQSANNLIRVEGFENNIATSAYGLFSGCSNLEYVDISGLTSQNLTNIMQMFTQCHKLKTAILGPCCSVATTSITDLFASCHALTKVDVSQFDTSNIKNFTSMFHDCNSLVELDLSNFNTEKVTDFDWMFYNCTSLKKLDLSSFVFSGQQASSAWMTFKGIPSDCLIYVKNQTAKDWVLTVRSDFTNVQIKNIGGGEEQ